MPGSAFYANIDTMNSKTYGWEPSISLKYTVDICTGILKKNSGRNTVLP